MNKSSSLSKGLIGILFSKKNEKVVYETPIVKITGEAYRKINLYAKIVSEIAGKDIECGGTMLNYRDRNDGVIRDTFLDYQIVNAYKTQCLNYGPEYIDYTKRLGMSWSGIWHSHGSCIPCHSHGDNKCIKWYHTNNKARKECTIKNSQKHSPSKKTAQDSIIFYSPSLVINKDEYINGGPCRSYYAEFLVGDGKGRDVKVKNAKLEIIKENNNIMPTLEEMVLEIGEKVKYKRLVFGRIMWGKKLKNFNNYNRVLEKYKRLQTHQVQGYQKEYSFNSNQKMILTKDILRYITIGG